MLKTHQLKEALMSPWIISALEEREMPGYIHFYLFCFLLFMEGFLVCNFGSEGLFNRSVWGSSGKVLSRNFLLEPIWLQNSFSIFLPLIHLSISFKCVLLSNPLIPDSCYEKLSLIKNMTILFIYDSYFKNIRWCTINDLFILRCPALTCTIQS